MSKQDRQGVRTAADLERKYEFGQDYSKLERLATSATEIASDARGTANNAAVEAQAATATANSAKSLAQETSAICENVSGQVSSLSTSVSALDKRVEKLEKNGGLSDEAMAEIVNEVIAALPTYNGEVEDA